MKSLTLKKAIVPGAVLIVSLIITFGAWTAVRADLTQQLAIQFNGQTKEITSLIQHRMDLYANVIYGAQGLFAASHSVEPDEWVDYATELDLPDNYSGISSMNYIKKVPADATSTYPYTIFPLTDKPDYYPITYTSTTSTAAVLPPPGSAASSTPKTGLGFDASSDPIRWQAMSLAEDTDTPVASGVVLTITTHVPSFGIYAPVYFNGEPQGTVAERRANLEGFVYVSFRVANLFQGLTSDPIFDKNIDLEIYDASSTGQISTSTLLFQKGDDIISAVDPDSVPFSRTSQVFVGGRTWTLFFSPLPGYGLQSIELVAPYAILIGGIVFSILLTWLIYIYVDSRERALSLAKKITKDLETSQSLLKASMENAADMIFVMKLGGRIIDANPAACSTLGYSKQELLAKSIADIDTIWNTEEKIAFLRESLLKDKTITIEGEQRKKDGTVFPVEARTTLFGDNTNQMVISVVRDISERKKSEEKLKERTDELERLNALMVGRELKMVDLKKQIKEGTSK